MEKVVKGRNRGIEWGLWERLEALDFVVDICLLLQCCSDMNEKLIRLQRGAETVGLRINTNKVKETGLSAVIEKNI
jgi:hypothetical protein